MTEYRERNGRLSYLLTDDLRFLITFGSMWREFHLAFDMGYTI